MRQRSDARKAHGHAGLVAAGQLHRLERQLEHVHRLHRAHRAETLGGMGADPAVEPADLRVVQPGIGLGHGHQRSPSHTPKV